MDLNFIFQNPPKKPLSLELSVHMTDKSAAGMFDYLKGLYITGLSILGCPNKPSRSVVLGDITLSQLALMKKYMLSFGITVFQEVYTPLELDCLFRAFLLNIDHISNLVITVCSDWKTSRITSIELKLSKLVDDECLEFWTILQSHNKVNMFLKFYKPTILKDFGTVLNVGDNKSHLIYFDFANPADFENKYKFNDRGVF